MVHFIVGFSAEKEDGIEDEIKEGLIIGSIIFVTQFPFFYLGILAVILLPAPFLLKQLPLFFNNNTHDITI